MDKTVWQLIEDINEGRMTMEEGQRILDDQYRESRRGDGGPGRVVLALTTWEVGHGRG